MVYKNLFGEIVDPPTIGPTERAIELGLIEPETRMYWVDFSFDIYASGSIEIEATSEEEALEIAREMPIQKLQDCIDPFDMDFGCVVFDGVKETEG